MNGQRILKFVLLAGIGSALGFAVFRGVDRTQPDHFWSSAQAALAAGKTAEAKIYLQNVVRVQPNHDAAHLALAKLLLDEATAAAGQPTTYADVPPAAFHLAEAARHRPTDMELQRQVLKLHLDAKRIRDGYDVARRVQRVDPNDADVLTAYARQAALAYVEAEKEVKQLLDRSQSYQARYTRAELDAATGNRAHLQQAAGEATAQALAATGDDLAALPKREFDAMTSLLLTGVQHAADAESIASRIDEALRICEKLARVEGDAKPYGPRLAQAAELATSVMQTAEKKPATSTKTAARIEAIYQTTIAAGAANPITLRQAALAAWKRGDIGLTLERIELGIAAAKKKSDKNEELELRLTAGRILAAARSPAAQSHLDALMAESDPKAVAWGHLLTGRLDLAQGKAEPALKHFSEARRRIGYTPEIREGFIDAYAALGRWDTALEELAGLAADKPASVGTADEQAVAAAAARDRYVALRRLQAYWGQQAWDRAAEAIDALTARQPNADSLKAVLGGLLHLAAIFNHR